MERRQTSSPKPWPQFEARTTFLRAPADDFDKIRLGFKTEFRMAGSHVTQLWNVETPMPVVVWAQHKSQSHNSSLMVLTATWSEPLAAISPASIEREGFPDMAHFRRYWMTRTKKRFTPLSVVHVYRVRRWEPSDVEVLGVRLLRKLYKGHIDAGPESISIQG